MDWQRSEAGRGLVSTRVLRFSPRLMGPSRRRNGSNSRRHQRSALSSESLRPPRELEMCRLARLPVIRSVRGAEWLWVSDMRTRVRVSYQVQYIRRNDHLVTPATARFKLQCLPQRTAVHRLKAPAFSHSALRFRATTSRSDCSSCRLSLSLSRLLNVVTNRISARWPYSTSMGYEDSTGGCSQKRNWTSRTSSGLDHY